MADDGAAADPALVRAWSVGGVQGSETLVQSRPVVRELRADFIADFLRAPSQTTLAAHAVASSGHGAEDIPVPRLGLARFQRWLGVRAEGALTADERDDAVRDRLKASLPDFLQRALSHSGDRELVVFGFLAALHASGDLNKPYVAPPQIRRALAGLDELLGHPARLNLFVCDGRTLGVIHRGGRLLLVDAPVPSGARRAMAHGPESRVQASLLIHDDGPADLPPAPEGAELRRLPEGIFTLHARQPGQVERDE
ncbi:hypothetical protein SAMN02745121_07025 [Nannocystis exedens]|uniref:Uncharacterized protein n=2 Tax=Nannocystis exedens TaxID=54 RepID=A0A1I2G527_9BACT|nr:hypothetical protein NAEX_00331 [Nannocystis exedens]SFF12087.1 hypothetical protein SAMN02745121_07025 [Nannocystis exedens]